MQFAAVGIYTGHQQHMGLFQHFHKGNCHIILHLGILVGLHGQPIAMDTGLACGHFDGQHRTAIVHGQLAVIDLFLSVLDGEGHGGFGIAFDHRI